MWTVTRELFFPVAVSGKYFTFYIQEKNYFAHEKEP